jgi:hypothetical protein
MDGSLIELINAADITQLKHLVVFKNETSGTEVITLNTIRILDLREKGISLIVPENTCGEKHSLLIFLIELPVKKPIKSLQDVKKYNDRLEVIGKVASVNREDGEDGFWTVEIDFTQYEGTKWKYFIRSYVERQEFIDKVGEED